jgi:hypothetical protein
MKTPISAEYRLAPLFLLLVWGTTVGVHAQGVVIDQSLQPPPIISGESYHYDAADATLMPQTGQEFTPSLNGLDFVNVNLVPQSTTNTGIFEIAIHQGNITAPVLGLSSQVQRSGGATGNNTYFPFLSTVPLTPGDTYVLEVLQIAGNSGWAIEVPGSAVVNGHTIDMNYPGGRLIYGGVPQATEDMIFQEGIFVPEPGVSALCLLGVLAFGCSKKQNVPPNFCFSECASRIPVPIQGTRRRIAERQVRHEFHDSGISR